MNDREKKIAEIREALEKATPGPWKAVDIGMPSGAVWRVDAKYMIATAMKKENADIVANAPEWLGFLLDELERKDEVIEEQKRQLFYKSQEITELREKSWQDQQWFKQASANITEMQKELDRIEREYAEERAAHNAHVTELCELEKENRKLREDIEKIRLFVETC